MVVVQEPQLRDFVTASAYSTRGGASDDARGDDGKGDGRKPASVARSAASNCAPT